MNIITDNPIVTPMAQMQLMPAGVAEMAKWVQSRRPACIPEGFDDTDDPHAQMMMLFPHNGMEEKSFGDGGAAEFPISDNELLVELAGRKCYDSFGLKAGKKTNREYIANTQAGEIPHASIMYHAKMSFFIGGVSRRVSHELIRHYVGADRGEEGSPSQESTRYVEHAGRYIAHPAILDDQEEMLLFERAMSENYVQYRSYIDRRSLVHEKVTGCPPKGLARKRIFESASPYLSHACETSFVWTTNPVALAKLIRERTNESADLEFQRLANVWKTLAIKHWPNLFPQLTLRS